MGRSDDMLTTQAVAGALEVTPPRVRQMVDEGKLAPPIELGPRTHLWHRTDVLATKLEMDGQRVSRTSAVMPTMETPLVRRHDRVIEFPLLGRKPGRAHIRVWEGPAPEGQRTVVLIGELRDTPGIVNFVEHIVEVVDERLLGGCGRDAVWFDYHPRALTTTTDQHRVNNLILRYTEDHPPQSTPDGRRENRANEQRPTDRSTVEPSWRPTTVAEVERVVGEPVECYPAPAYTPITIERWQSTRRTADVEHDTVELAQAAAALRAIAAIPTGHPRTELAHITRTILATIIRERLDEIDFLVTGRYGRGPSWDDGIAPPRAAAIGTPPHWPATFAARLVPPQLAPIDAEELARHPGNCSWPTTPDEAAGARPVLQQLRHWSADTGPFGDEPDDMLYRAVGLAQRRLTSAMRRADPNFAAEDYPAHQVLLLRVMGDTDPRYLAQVTWDRSPIMTHHHRELAAPFLAEDRNHLRFGVDPWQRLVASAGPELGQPEEFAVLWPNRPTMDRPSDDATLLADGGENGGDRPVYIEEPDGTLDLLPRDPDHAYSGWSFGYGGGGPSALVNAIVRYISLVDCIDRTQVPSEWIDDQVSHSHRERLRINIGDLRRRIP